jgi:YesN/AraC family two-component response regulator
MSIILSDDQYNAIRSYARSNMLNLIATGSPASSVFRGQERTGIKITDNPAHFCLFVTGKDETFLYSIGKNKNDNVSIFNRICTDLKNLKSALGYKLEPFYHNVTKQVIILINIPENDNEIMRKKLFYDINEIVNNAYQIQLIELFDDNHIISAVTEDFYDFGFNVRKSFDLAVKYINDYHFFLKQYLVIDNSIMSSKIVKLEEYSIVMQVSILKESITNYKLDNIEATISKLFIEIIKPTFSIEICDYAINLLNNLISKFNSILKCNINDLKIEDFIFIEDLKKEAVNKFKNISARLYNKNLKISCEINKTKKYIEEHFQEQLTIENIANFIGFNKNYLCTKFKNEMGITIHQYLISFRIEHAKQLLINTDYSIENVAFCCGFYNVIYFRTIFKKNTGLTPTTFRDYYGKQNTN